MFNKCIFLKSVLIAIFSHTIKSIEFHEFYIDRFLEDRVLTEYTAYQTLKNEHSNLNINYVAIPWAVLINKQQTHLVENVKVENGWTVCQHDYYEDFIPLMKKIGIKVLFTQNVNNTYDGITVLPFPDIATNGIDPALTKDIYCSFVGSEWTNPIRKKMFDLLQDKSGFTMIKRTGTWHFLNNNKDEVEREKKEFQDILSRSKFSLCPRGVGANTFRFWESLQAGAIPILISDNLNLPDGVDWANTIVHINESEISSIPHTLKQINSSKEATMKTNCLKAFKQFSGKNFVSPIINHYIKSIAT